MVELKPATFLLFKPVEDVLARSDLTFFGWSSGKGADYNGVIKMVGALARLWFCFGSFQGVVRLVLVADCLAFGWSL